MRRVGDGFLYEKSGFFRAGKTEPMWNYAGEDHWLLLSFVGLGLPALASA